MFCDPKVSRTKFERELAEFRELGEVNHRRGVWLMDATFPNVFVLLVAVHPKPCPMVAFGIQINFENYDVESPSVQLVHPVTRAQLKKHELPHLMQRQGAPAFQNGPIMVMQPPLPLVQGWDGQLPFICLPGVREYHRHPAHTGDSWWLHRKSGQGRLSTILNVLATYAIDPVKGLNVQLQPQVSLAIPEFPA